MSNKKFSKGWFKNWQKGLDELEGVRRLEQIDSSLDRVATALEDSFQYALKNRPKSTTSGLVEMQKVFLSALK